MSATLIDTLFVLLYAFKHDKKKSFKTRREKNKKMVE